MRGMLEVRSVGARSGAEVQVRWIGPEGVTVPGPELMSFSFDVHVVVEVGTLSSFTDAELREELARRTG